MLYVVKALYCVVCTEGFVVVYVVKALYSVVCTEGFV